MGVEIQHAKAQINAKVSLHSLRKILQKVISALTYTAAFPPSLPSPASTSIVPVGFWYAGTGRFPSYTTSRRSYS